MTLGGSLIPGALGSLFVEVLPFLRAIATGIQLELGDGHPGILPTVMAAYAMTSLLVGSTFLLLGLFRCGRIVDYFPRNVLVGAIGAIGLLLFGLGLELTIPSDGGHLELSTAGDILFNKTHLPLLATSVITAVFLSLSIRSRSLSRLVRGATEHAIYIPMVCLAVAFIFWIIAASTEHTHRDALAVLRSKGWLFAVEEAQSRTTPDWNYWALFDFSRVEWYAMTRSIKDIIMLVIIAVISLPIFVPAIALTVDTPLYSMNWEFFGHGASNILAGLAGTVPNMVVMSYSRFFTLAGGGRIEAVIVTAITLVFFFISSYILPYVPTIAASVLVLFLGIEMVIEALWDAPQNLLPSEWLVILATMISCAAIGFAPGVGIGVAVALAVCLWWTIVETFPKVISVSKATRSSNTPPKHAFDSATRLESQKSLQLETEVNDIEKESQPIRTKSQPTIVILKNYVNFVSIPRIDVALKSSTNVVIDFSSASRVETSVSQALQRHAQEAARDRAPGSLIFAGVDPESILHADLVRGGLECNFIQGSGERLLQGYIESLDNIPRISTFETVTDALRWHQNAEVEPDLASSDAFDLLQRWIPEEVFHGALALLPNPGMDFAYRMAEAGLKIVQKCRNEALIYGTHSQRSIFLVIKGKFIATPLRISGEVPVSLRSSYSVIDSIKKLPHAISRICNSWFKRNPYPRSPYRTLSEESGRRADIGYEGYLVKPGDILGIGPPSKGLLPTVAIACEECWVLEVDVGNLHGLSYLTKLAAG
ncbi:hypothetical protein BCR34DRAFT_605537 [Clohesyomyces aquaticus]|uniref:STAS domain-containing protein n=1 Tax=Clohesyomyces aquaticus TaxID=1231657 RepID=A0A1Y1YXA3_9PLEO|nr:hypothetical protein BCR34DRAFT_605537 [Clohesyomyces aquaticus]